MQKHIARLITWMPAIMAALMLGSLLIGQTPQRDLNAPPQRNGNPKLQKEMVRQHEYLKAQT